MRKNGGPLLLGSWLLVACGSRTFLSGVGPDDGLPGGADGVARGGSGGAVAKGGSGGAAGSVATAGSGGGATVGGSGGGVSTGGSGGSLGVAGAGAGGGVPTGSAGSGSVAGSGGTGGSGGGAAGSVSPVGGGTSNGKCGACLQKPAAQKECGAEIAACAADPGCAAVLACSDACSGKPNVGACIQGCQSAWASGGAAYYALAGCWLCGGACAAICSAPAAFCEQFDGPPPVTGGGSKCAICQHEVLGADVCATQIATCEGDPACTAIRACLEECDGDANCGQSCVQGQAPNEAYLDVAGCLLCTACSDVCKPAAALCDAHGP